MNNKYKHPWLPYPYTWVLILLTIFSLFLTNGWICIVLIWLYKCAYNIWAPISYEKRVKKRWEQTKTDVYNGEHYVFPNGSEVIKALGTDEGGKVLKKTYDNGNNTKEVKALALKRYRVQKIEEYIKQDCDIWNGAYLAWSEIPWIKTKQHAAVEVIFGCPDPSCHLPINYKEIIHGIQSLPLSNEEEEYLENGTLSEALLNKYKREANGIICWDISYEEKEHKLQTLKEFILTKNIRLFNIREEDVK